MSAVGSDGLPLRRQRFYLRSDELTSHVNRNPAQASLRLDPLLTRAERVRLVDYHIPYSPYILLRCEFVISGTTDAQTLDNPGSDDQRDALEVLQRAIRADVAAAGGIDRATHGVRLLTEFLPYTDRHLNVVDMITSIVNVDVSDVPGFNEGDVAATMYVEFVCTGRYAEAALDPDTADDGFYLAVQVPETLDALIDAVPGFSEDAKARAKSGIVISNYLPKSRIDLTTTPQDLLMHVNLGQRDVWMLTETPQVQEAVGGVYYRRGDLVEVAPPGTGAAGGPGIYICNVDGVILSASNPGAFDTAFQFVAASRTALRERRLARDLFSIVTSQASQETVVAAQDRRAPPVDFSLRVPSAPKGIKIEQIQVRFTTGGNIAAYVFPYDYVYVEGQGQEARVYKPWIVVLEVEYREESAM